LVGELNGTLNVIEFDGEGKGQGKIVAVNSLVEPEIIN
jgi:hypothetical protein